MIERVTVLWSSYTSGLKRMSLPERSERSSRQIDAPHLTGLLPKAGLCFDARNHEQRGMMTRRSAKTVSAPCHKAFALIKLLFLSALSAGCQNPTVPQPVEASTTTPVETNALPTVTEKHPHLEDWAVYTDLGRGFSFQYPPNWSVQEIPSDGTRPSIIRVRWEMLRLVIQFSRVEDHIPVERYVPVGDPQVRGTAEFLGQRLSRIVMVEDERVKGVAYRAPEGPLQAGNLVFDVSLRSVAADECLQEFERECSFQAIDIPAALQTDADLIISSFRLLPASSASADAYPGWVKYTQADYGFSFRYPSTWNLREGENFVSVGQGTLRLVLGYRNVSEEKNVYFERELPFRYDTFPAGTVRFLAREISKTLMQHEGRVKAVLYNNAERIDIMDRVFLIALQDFAVDYLSVDIPETLQTEADQVIASFDLADPTASPPMAAPVATRLPPTPLPATAVPATAVAGPDGANVRGGPGTHYPLVAHLPPGARVPVVGRYSDWWQIVHGDEPAWRRPGDRRLRCRERAGDCAHTTSPAGRPAGCGRAGRRERPQRSRNGLRPAGTSFSRRADSGDRSL